MAIPLSPESGLFPDTYVAPFIVADEVGELADDVAASFSEFRAIEDAIREQGLRIRTVFETKAFDPLKEELKPHTIAKVTKASPLWRLLGETELVIQFRQWFWERFSEQERRGVLHHELSHIEIREPGPDGQAKVSLREHDVEEFALTVKRFGPRRDHHAAFFRAFLDWHDQHERPEPTPLRAVDEADLRPSGEVNADELRGAASNDVREAEGATDGADDDLLPGPIPARRSRRNGQQPTARLN